MAFQSHVHHAGAAAWFEGSIDDDCAFCRLTQQGFLRLATNPKAFGDEAVTLEHAWQLYDALIADPRVSFAAEPDHVERIWRGYSDRRTFSPKVWSDAYLAAFARCCDLAIVTFDRGFSNYEGLKHIVLS